MGWAGYVLTAGCPTFSDMRPILHAEVPDDLSNDIAVEIEIIAVPRTAPQGTYEARVERVIKGEGIGKRILFRSNSISSCDGFPGVGARGILVGNIVQRDHGELLMSIRRARFGGAAKVN